MAWQPCRSSAGFYMAFLVEVMALSFTRFPGASSVPAPPPNHAPAPGALPDYAELHCLSNFSFQRGASHPQELVERAHELGYQALALTDECSVAGVVRAHGVAKKRGFHLILGSEFLWGELRMVVLARNANGWGNLCEFITAARAAAPKGQYHAGPLSPWAQLQDCEIVIAPCRSQLDASDLIAVSACISSARGQFDSYFDGHVWLAV